MEDLFNSLSQPDLILVFVAMGYLVGIVYAVVNLSIVHYDARAKVEAAEITLGCLFGLVPIVFLVSLFVGMFTHSDLLGRMVDFLAAPVGFVMPAGIGAFLGSQSIYWLVKRIAARPKGAEEVVS